MCILPLCIFLAELVDGAEVITDEEPVGSTDAEEVAGNVEVVGMELGGENADGEKIANDGGDKEMAGV